MSNLAKETAGEFAHGHGTAGTTRSRLVAENSKPPFKLSKGVLIRCPGAADTTPNTDAVWVGGANVTANSNATSGGIPIAPGEAIMFPLDDPSDLWIISTAADQDAAWFAS